MLTDLKTAQKVTGAKQVTRALKNGTARRVFLAQDADPRVTEPIQALCQEQGTATESVDTMAAPAALPWAALWPPSWRTEPMIFAA